MTDEPTALRAARLAKAIARGLHVRSEGAWHQVELTLAQLRCLFVVSDQGPISIGGVAGHLGIGLPSASALVDRLVEQGFVQRREDPQDRRRTLASATEAGASLADQLRQGSMQTMLEWLHALRPEDLSALVQGLEALARVAGLPECADATGARRPMTVES